MKKLLSLVTALLLAGSTAAATLNPVQLLNPSGSTTGQAILSTGASSAPAWGNVSISTLTGVLPVANGGTNASSASGTALDNITGFSGTGFLTRTGSGAYAFQSATNGITLSNLTQITANVVLGNPSGSTANVGQIGMPSCSTSSSALNWTTSTGFTCGTVASSGANANITSLSGLTTALSVAQGGTGRATLTAHSVLLGNGTSGVNSVGPNSTSNLALISQGSSADPIFGNPTGVLLNIQKFASSGTYTPTTGATTAVVCGVGAGGAGGGGAATGASTYSIGAGGGGGAFGCIYITSSLSSQTVTIGAAGTGVSAGTGGSGGTTSFGSLMSLPGGTGGGAYGPTSSFFCTPLNSSSAPSGSGTFLFSSAGGASSVGILNEASSISTQATGGVSPYGSGSTNSGGYGQGGSGALVGLSGSAAAGNSGGGGVIFVYEYR